MSPFFGQLIGTIRAESGREKRPNAGIKNANGQIQTCLRLRRKTAERCAVFLAQKKLAAKLRF
jgi:hypothetical protein